MSNILTPLDVLGLIMLGVCGAQHFMVVRLYWWIIDIIEVLNTREVLFSLIYKDLRSYKHKSPHNCVTCLRFTQNWTQ